MVRVMKKFVGITVGDTFSCYEDLRLKMELVERQTGVPLYTRDCVTLKGALKKRPKVASMANPKLVYHSLQYICVFGRIDLQRDLKYQNQGLSKEVFNQDGGKCLAEIRIGLSLDCQLLRVKKIVDIHNHKLSQSLFSIVTSNRSLNAQLQRPSSFSPSPRKRGKYQSQEEKLKTLSVKPRLATTKITSLKHAKRKHQGHTKYQVIKKKAKVSEDYFAFAKQAYSEKSESERMGKDQQPARQQTGKFNRRVGFKRLVEEMYDIEDAAVEVYEEGLKPQAIFFQTAEMKDSFASFPEVLLIDSSYPISVMGMKLYVLTNADGNGECSIVAFWFLMRENVKNLSFLTDMLIEHNPETSQVKVVMLDKEFLEKDVVVSSFSDAVTFTCYHHVVRSFQKEVYADKDIGFENEEERDTCMKLFKKMALAKDMNTYLLHFERFRLYSPALLYTYFLSEWHKIKDQWVDGFKDPNAYFLNQRHSKLDVINQIVKNICDNFETVPKFFHDLMKSVATLQLERKQRSLNVPVKGPLITSEFHIAEMQYRNFLTPYGFTFVRRQMHCSANVKIQKSVSRDECSIRSTKYGELETSTTSCPCVFFTVTGLPCSHIFAVRRDKGLPTYETSLCKIRWSLKYLRKSNNLPTEESDLVPDALFGYGELDQQDLNDGHTDTDANKEESLSNAGDDMGFVPSCTSSSIDAETISVDRNLEEEMIIDEVDPDCDLSLEFDDSILNKEEDQEDEIVNMDLDTLLSKL